MFSKITIINMTQKKIISALKKRDKLSSVDYLFPAVLVTCGRSVTLLDTEGKE